MPLFLGLAGAGAGTCAVLAVCSPWFGSAPIPQPVLHRARAHRRLLPLATRTLHAGLYYAKEQGMLDSFLKAVPKTAAEVGLAADSPRVEVLLAGCSSAGRKAS